MFFYNYLVGFIGSPKLSQGKPAQYATVWNDTLPGHILKSKEINIAYLL